MAIVSGARHRRVSTGLAAVVGTLLSLVGAVVLTAAPAPLASASPSAPGTIAPTGTMTTPRTLATATLLPNGKVLVAGGDVTYVCTSRGLCGVGNTVPLASAELYDPTTRTWQPTGSMAAARAGAAATLLPNGKVLVAGGNLSGGVVTGPSAELYDPATGTWQATGAMITYRAGVQDTLLPNGMVLAAGGSSANATELYNPATGSWQATGTMTAARGNAAAALLRNGIVLVAGPDATSELYNPATGAWQATGSMTSGGHGGARASVLPDGTVLVAGGSDFFQYLQPNGSNSVGQAATSIYDPSTGTWRAGPPLTTGRGEAGAVVLGDGSVLVTGGFTNTGLDIAHGQVNTTYPLNSTEIYDGPAGVWRPGPNLFKARQNHTATLLADGTVLVAGGYDGQNVLASAEIYDPAVPATGPQVTLSIRFLSFDPVAVGDRSTKSFVVRNTGWAPLVITGVSAGTPDVVADVSACGNVSPGASCTILVTYVPHTAGSIQTSLLLDDNDPGAPATLPLGASAFQAPAPVITAISPTSGPVTGGTTVTITGQGLPSSSQSGSFTVAFGGVPAAAGFACTTVLGPYGYITTCGAIVATSPPGTGTVDVTITTAGGTSGATPATKFTYGDVPPPPAPPTITAVAPATGPAAGGTVVTVTGTNLSGGSVAFGPVAATGVACSATTCAATAPAGSGTVDVKVTTAAGTSIVSTADQFTYQAAPPPPPAGNLVPNPGFESAGVPADVWGSKLARSSASVNTGGYSLAQTASSSSGGWDLDANSASYAPVVAGKTYTATVWVRATKAATVVLNVDLLSSTGKYLTSANGPKAVLAANTWTKLTATVKPTGSQVKAAFEPNFSATTSGTVIYWDDMSLVAN